MDIILTIITICKNQPFIRETCESVISQIDKDFEWIVVDWWSTDWTLDILNEYKPKISVLISENDTGVYNAMNKWIKVSRWEYLLFLNGWDMLYESSTIKNIKQYLINWDSEVYYGDSFRLFERKEDCFIKTYPDKLEKNFFLTNTLAHQSSFIKRELFIKYWLYREDINIVSDKEKWLYFIDNNVRFEHLNFVCSIFRMNWVSRKNTDELKQEKIKLLKQYYPDEMLYWTNIPYLQELFW
jgi:glycosyltransferase involved in cell wall biosynthesis